MGSCGGEYSPTEPVAQAPTANSRLLNSIHPRIFLNLDIFMDKTPYNLFYIKLSIPVMVLKVGRLNFRPLENAVSGDGGGA